MKSYRRGFTLIELIFAIGLSLTVLAAGYSAYFSITRADEVENRRELLIITANDAMNRIKQDIRESGLSTAFGRSLVLNTTDGRITYKNLPNGAGIERLTRNSRSLFKGVSASFISSGKGVNVSVRAAEKVHRRMIRVDLNCYVAPR